MFWTEQSRGHMPSDRFQLLDKYKTPRFRFGQSVMDEVRGVVTTVMLSGAPIPWPVGKRGRQVALVHYGDLVRAVFMESNQAVAYWWGVTPQTVTKWRKALGAKRSNPGSHRLWHNNALSEPVAAGREKANMRSRNGKLDAGRRAAIAAAKRGVPRPRHVVDGMRKRMLGVKLSAETRRKISRTHRTRGTRPPKAGGPWSAKEDAHLKRFPAAEVVKRTGRTLTAVYMRRIALRLPDGRRSNG